MSFYGDYHTHTTYSHGSGSPTDNAFAAKEKGLKEIAISDHGFAHPLYGVAADKLGELKQACVSARERSGVSVLLGLESNIISSMGECDLTEKYYDKFDVFLAGAHVFVNYKDVPTWWNLGVVCPVADMLGVAVSEKVKAFVTETYIKTVRSKPVDILTHLNFRVVSNVKEVADCCRENGTYIEINTKKTHLTDEQWREVASTGVNFVIGSDAHGPDRIADFAPALAIMERAGIDRSRVHNLDRRPDFRFAKYKGVTL